MTSPPTSGRKYLWRLIVVGGHTRTIGKTQLVCDIISAFPETRWIAGKITQYGHGVCAQNGHDCDCAPDEHICAISWEKCATTGTDSSRFLAAGAQRSFWLRTKQGFLAEGLPILRGVLQEISAEENLKSNHRVGQSPASDAPTSIAQPLALIVESNALMQFVKPSLFFTVLAPAVEDFKDSARAALHRASALVIRGSGVTAAGAPLWTNIPAKLLREKPSVNPAEGDPLPEPLEVLVRRALEAPPSVSI
jgi:hypothetical protein